jgi:hypothetical protein
MVVTVDELVAALDENALKASKTYKDQYVEFHLYLNCLFKGNSPGIVPFTHLFRPAREGFLTSRMVLIRST